jgi:hypothetical protein
MQGENITMRTAIMSTETVAYPLRGNIMDSMTGKLMVIV